jgi:hypothetical protein
LGVAKALPGRLSRKLFIVFKLRGME